MKNKPGLIFLALLWFLSACSPMGRAEPTRVLAEPNAAADASPTPGNEGAGQRCPTPDCVSPRPTTDPEPPLRLSLPTPGAEPISAWRPPQYPVPMALREFDHFYFARPIAADVINWPVANYRYGGTELSPGITHTGVDIPARAGTPVLAAGPGTVTWAGWGLFSSTPDNIKDPYGIAVAIRHDFGYHGQPLFTVYAHLQDVTVAPGQWVNTGDQIGLVGSTGYTTGPHLHFELRIGVDSIYYTRNPELWIAPPQGWGVLAGRVTESNRDPAHSQVVSIRSLDSSLEWTVNTYGPEAVNSDDYYNENMVISDLPAGRYRISITFPGKRTNLIEITVEPGLVSYFVYRDKYGFVSTNLPPVPTTTPVPTQKPGQVGLNQPTPVPRAPWQIKP